MTGKGDNLENQVKILFENLLKECGYTVIKNRKQKSGTQDGFDNEIIIVDEFNRRYKIHLECKDYSTKLNFSEAIVKIPQIVTSYKPDILIFLSPKVQFSNPYNDTRLVEFYERFDVPIEFLTPDNSVEELIALDESIYKSIYGEVPKFKVDRNEKIEWFKKFIFSSKPLKKIVLNESDRISYITNITLIENYIERTICKASDSREVRYFYNSKHDNSLINLCNSFLNSKNQDSEGIVILGNPGLGKSIELKNLAIHFWENYNSIKWVPFYREIRTFTSSDKISDYLPSNWNEIPQLLIILDGLDEVSYSQDFCAKLEKFIIDNTENKNSIQFVLSCRTNIYENVIKDISKFETYVLNNIYYSDAINFLKINYNLLQKDSNRLSFSYNQKEFLENPYYLRIFGEYYKQYRKLPSNKSDLLNKFVAKRLEDDRKKFKNKNFDKSDIENSCKKIALSMEAMQINEIKDSKLRIILGEKKDNFTDSSFSERVFGKDNWKFEHRNLQEYFVAKSLKNLSFHEIINFIRLDEKTNKTHPSWLNSISYLISVLNKKSNEYKELINWLIENEPEVLFKSDSDRINPQTRFKIFKDYFNKRCKIDTLWIRSYDSGVMELAKFADCEDSVIFLIDEIRDESNHRRARISAIDLLSNMDLTFKANQIQELILFLLEAPVDKVDFRFKANIIYQFKKLNYHLDLRFLNKIISVLKDIDFHEITSAVLGLIEEVEVDYYFTYIKNLAPKITGDIERKYKKTDNLSTNEEGKLENILVSFKNPNHLLFSIEFLLSNSSSFSTREKKENLQKIINKLSELHFKDDNVYKKLLDFVDSDFYEKTFSYEYEKIIFSYFEKTNTTDRAFNDLYKSKSNFDSKRKFLVLSANKENIQQIIKDYKNNILDKTEVIYFTNNLSHYNHDLALSFQSSVETETDIQYKKKLVSVDERNRWNNFHKNKHQLGFDLLFKKNQLLKLAQEYFDYSKEEIITWENNSEYKKEFYDSLDLQLKFPQTFMGIIYDSLRNNNGKVKVEDVKKLIRNEIFLFYKIKDEITSSHSGYFEITLKQVEVIKKWCNKNLEKADFKNHNQNTKKYNRNRCHLLWFFRHHFDFHYEKEYLLDMLFIDGRIKLNEKEIGYKYIIDKVDKKLIDERVLFNLQNVELNQMIYDNHISYCIENELKEAYQIIEEYLKSYTDRTYFMSTLLYSYFEKTKRIGLLKSLVKPHPNDEQKDGLTWDAIKLLIASEEYEYVTKKLLEFRNLKPENEDLLIVIKFLIRLNHHEGFKFLNKWFSNAKNRKKQLRNVLSTDDYYVHTNKKSIPHLVKLFKISHKSDWDFDEMHHPRRISHETLEVICRENGQEECLLVLKLLAKTKNELKSTGLDLFYINILINDITQQLNNHKSKSMSFEDLVNKIEQLKYLII